MCQKGLTLRSSTHAGGNVFERGCWLTTSTQSLRDMLSRLTGMPDSGETVRQLQEAIERRQPWQEEARTLLGRVFMDRQRPGDYYDAESGEQPIPLLFLLRIECSQSGLSDLLEDLIKERTDEITGEVQAVIQKGKETDLDLLLADCDYFGLFADDEELRAFIATQVHHEHME